MSKRLLTVLVAIAGFAAFVFAPSVASAIELTDGTGKTADTFIRAHNVGNALMTTGAGNIVCTKAEMTGHLTQNGIGGFASDIETASFTGTESENRCASPLGATKVTLTSLNWCMKNIETLDQFEVRGANCNEESRPLTFILDFAGLECQYQRSKLTGSFPTEPNEALLTVSEVEFVREGGTFLCPASGKLDMTFTLENDTAGTNPLYIQK